MVFIKRWKMGRAKKDKEGEEQANELREEEREEEEREREIEKTACVRRVCPSKSHLSAQFPWAQIIMASTGTVEALSGIIFMCVYVCVSLPSVKVNPCLPTRKAPELGQALPGERDHH